MIIEYTTYKILELGKYESATSVHFDAPARTTAGADDMDCCICVSCFTGDNNDSRARKELEEWADDNGLVLSGPFNARWHHDGERAVSVIFD